MVVYLASKHFTRLLKTQEHFQVFASEATRPNPTRSSDVRLSCCCSSSLVINQKGHSSRFRVLLPRRAVCSSRFVSFRKRKKLQREEKRREAPLWSWPLTPTSTKTSQDHSSIRKCRKHAHSFLEEKRKRTQLILEE